jgi:indole-3-glycerol phosphate synthase
MRFVEALRSARVPVIAEIKLTDGHGTGLAGGRGAGELVDAYTEGGACCLSVVTGRWFGGSAALLAEVTGRTALPVLVKDFLVRRGQLAAAADAGAAAVLLTAGLLPAGVLQGLIGHALRLGLTPFVEVTSEREIAAVVPAQRCVIAVNNKDIRDRERGAGDIGRSLRLLPAVRAAGTPCPVSASGIDTPRTAAELLGAGYAGLLVGTALLRADSPAAWLAQLSTSVGAR